MKKTYEQKIEDGLQKDKNKIQMRYYFWDWCLPYGWRQMGSGEGYETLKKLKKECEWHFKNSNNWKILKAEEIETKIK